MARKAKPDRKGKILSGDVAPEAGVGHNGHLSDDEKALRFFGYQKRWKAARDALSIIEEEAKTALGKTVISGFRTADSLKDEKGEKKLKDRIEQQLRIARWMGVPIGTQTDLFPEIDRTPIGDRAYTDGKMHGLAGDPAKPPHDPSTEAYRRWMDGHAEGNSTLAQSGFKPFPQAAATHDEEEDVRPRFMTQPNA